MLWYSTDNYSQWPIKTYGKRILKRICMCTCVCTRVRAHTHTYTQVFPGSSVVKKPPANAGDAALILWLRRSPREGNGNPLQYSCLETSMDREAWRAADYGVTKSQMQLNMCTYTHIYILESLCCTLEGNTTL